MMTIPYFLRLFPECPICKAPTEFSPLQVSGVYGCINPACTNIILCIAGIYQEKPGHQYLTESIIDLRLGPVVYRLATKSSALIINPTDEFPYIENFPNLLKLVALFRDPATLIKRYPIRGACIPQVPSYKEWVQQQLRNQKVKDRLTQIFEGQENFEGDFQAWLEDL